MGPGEARKLRNKDGFNESCFISIPLHIEDQIPEGDSNFYY